MRFIVGWNRFWLRWFFVVVRVVRGRCGLQLVVFGSRGWPGGRRPGWGGRYLQEGDLDLEFAVHGSYSYKWLQANY